MIALHQSPTPRRLLIVWALLIAATLVTYVMGEMHAAGPAAVFAMLAISFLKGRWVARDFMGLAHVRLLWRAVVVGWVLVITALIALAYWMGLR